MINNTPFFVCFYSGGKKHILYETLCLFKQHFCASSIVLQFNFVNVFADFSQRLQYWTFHRGIRLENSTLFFVYSKKQQQNKNKTKAKLKTVSVYFIIHFECFCQYSELNIQQQNIQYQCDLHKCFKDTISNPCQRNLLFNINIWQILPSLEKIVEHLET